MTNLRLLGAAAFLAAAIATPAFAQQAVDEPGMQAFYQSLGVGSQSHPTMSAMASAPRSYAQVRVKHVAPKAAANARN
jgi:hypothetical protein